MAIGVRVSSVGLVPSGGHMLAPKTTQPKAMQVRYGVRANWATWGPQVLELAFVWWCFAWWGMRFYVGFISQR